MNLNIISLEDVQSKIEAEADEFGDILQDNFIDSYNNLTVKTLHILRFFSFSDSGNILKTDDDSFINLEALERLIDDRVNGQGHRLIGDLQVNHATSSGPPPGSSLEVKGPGPGVHRYYDKMSLRIQKWAVPKYMYKWAHFPTFLSGSGYLIGGQETASCLIEASRDVDLVHLEDVFTTGLCAERCNLTRFNDPGFDYRQKPPNFRIAKWNVLVHRCPGRMAKFIKQLQ